MNSTIHSGTSILDPIGHLSWLLLCFLLPISGGLVPVPLVLTIVVWGMIAFRERPAIRWLQLWPLFLFYGLHVVGMFWTTDVDFGLFDLQIKLSLLLLPFIAMIVLALYPELAQRTMVAFTAGFIVAIALGLWKAYGCYTLNGTPNCFSQSTLSFDIHPSYTAWYGCWILAYWGERLITGEVPEKWLRNALFGLLPLVMVFIVMLASKSGVIGLAMVVIYLLYVILARSNSVKRWYAVSAALLLVAIAAVSQGKLVMARMDAALNALTTFDRDPEHMINSSEGNALRIVAWTCSLDRLAQEPFGAGTGDIKHVLMDCYTEHGATEAARRNLNSHCQFLQGGVALGWPGIIATMLLALVPLVQAWRIRSPSMMMFMVLFIMNAAVESVLEVQAGVVFFAIFIGIHLGTRTSRSIQTDQKSLATA